MAKVIRKSNYGSEVFCETVYQSDIDIETAKEICKEKNSNEFNDFEAYYVAEEDNYILYDINNPDHPYHGLEITSNSKDEYDISKEE